MGSVPFLHEAENKTHTAKRDADNKLIVFFIIDSFIG